MSKVKIKFGNFIVKIDWIYEAIVTTLQKNPKNDELKYNAAPMGIIFENQQKLIIKPYINTNTFKNIQQNGCAGVNFSNDVSMFYKAAIKKSELTLKDFIMAKKIICPLLKESKTRFEVIAEKIVVDGAKNRANIQCNIENHEIVDSKIEPYTRGDFAVIESIIHFTKINFLMEKHPERGKKLISKILDYNDFIKRVYPGSDLEKIMDELVFHVSKSAPYF